MKLPVILLAATLAGAGTDRRQQKMKEFSKSVIIQLLFSECFRKSLAISSLNTV
jgi:hypothetical protein